ncbi:MAG: hypothetical protein ACOYL3_06795 [Desulfuromonadaceae bacterium]
MSTYKLKRRAQAHKLLDSIDLPRISSALRLLATAASGNRGSDCYIHAAIAQAILNRLGVTSKIVAGYAAFRVGDGDSDVILHSPVPGMPLQPGAVAYHVWLEAYGNIIDFTAYSLRTKAAQLDALDGGTTNVTWCPDYLFVLKTAVSPMRDVIQLRAGLFHYLRVPTLEAKIIAVASPLDDGDANTAWLLYQNPTLQVFGPNNMPLEESLS